MLANTLFFLSMTWFPLTLDLNASVFLAGSDLDPSLMIRSVVGTRPVTNG